VVFSSATGGSTRWRTPSGERAFTKGLVEGIRGSGLPVLGRITVNMLICMCRSA